MSDFVVRIDTAKLSDKQAAAIAGAIQMAVMSELGKLDLAPETHKKEKAQYFLLLKILLRKFISALSHLLQFVFPSQENHHLHTVSILLQIYRQQF